MSSHFWVAVELPLILSLLREREEYLTQPACVLFEIFLNPESC